MQKNARYKKGGNLSECLYNIIKEIDDNKSEYEKEGKEVFLIIIEKVLKRKVGEKKANEIIKKLEVGDETVMQVLETIDEENEDLREEGRKFGNKEERLKIIKEMLRKNMPIDLISEITHASKQVTRKISNS